ncbi:FAD-dependent oxidoreductase [Sporomusa acidovorans]|uniref:Fumarate reductase flavoprotein subunit n=1 Tax=Sporomusa acidovorans (strain ATCC 49682 / DSM 3132 / Mol) TaxID=1123286 RepID=A0ABZ3J626_SPOA4|nr:FAD-binding protein [Sporomusa acidovorans]OZC18537.1 fumarate reductase flavoprotein subunit [Sporomusa acidovorans DSM 3132]SDE37746.1 succinate dehydrogenase / fumarate reductase flavoprotein subunit [Sporomusa acidovorans]
MIFTSGLEIMDALLKKARAIGVDLKEDIAVLDLVTVDGAVNGAIGLDIRSGELVHFRAKAVILASGGWHKAFWPTTGMRDLAGEGMAMAYRAGAALGNMEFVTFCCNVFLSPPAWQGSIAPYVMSLLVGGGSLTNSTGEDILQQYDPFVVKVGTSTEWNKSFISYATTKEVLAGKGSPNGGVYFSRGDVPWEKVSKIAEMLFPNWRCKGIDFSEWGRMLEVNEAVEVGAATEYFDGGIVVNDQFETGLKGLYAAGECTLGPFGANRVFAAITEMLVHGTTAGANAGTYAQKAKVLPPEEEAFTALEEKIEAPLRRAKGYNPAQVRRQVQEAAHKHLGPIRDKQNLTKFIEYLGEVKTNLLPNLATSSKSRVYNKEWLDALELGSIAQLLEVATQSALARTESRGVHFRQDYPITDNDGWLVEQIVRLEGDGFKIDRRPVTVTIKALPSGKAPYLEFMKQMMQSHSDTGGKH